MLFFLGSLTDPSTNMVKEKTGHKSIWFLHNVFDYFVFVYVTKQYNFLYSFYPPQVLTVEILNIYFLIHVRNNHHIKNNRHACIVLLLWGMFVTITGWWDREDSVPQVHQFHDAESWTLHNHEEKTNQGRLYVHSVNCQGTPNRTN